MNYKLSKREEFLLKTLGIIGLVAFIIFIETKLICGINQSRIDLFQSLDQFFYSLALYQIQIDLLI